MCKIKIAIAALLLPTFTHSLHLSFRSKKWVICTLDNGSITGYGHLYDFIEEERSKAADVLIVHDGTYVIRFMRFFQTFLRVSLLRF